jgi:3-phenylpropionate/cinnamic acid dioxygenase small subunit
MRDRASRPGIVPASLRATGGWGRRGPFWHYSLVELTIADRLEIGELIASHGHVVDSGDLARLDELFTDDVEYDLRAMGGDCLQGTAAVRDVALLLGDGNPVAHHVTNIVLHLDEGAVRAQSKFLGVRRDGTVGSGVYDDELRRTPNGWRISRRRVSVRREPMKP